RILLILTPLLAMILSACGTNRKPQTEAYLLQRRDEDQRSYLDATTERYTALIHRTKAQLDDFNAGRRKEPPVIDYLIITGGGDIGAFGAGFLKGWSTIPRSNPLARPHFDAVTGVSTGALIAPFAFLGDSASDEQVVSLYRNPRPDWVKPRWPLYFLPSNISFAEVPGLERELRENISHEMIDRIAHESDDSGRLLFVNTTNLDDGSPHVFYLIPEARRAKETGDYDRFQKILLASSGIPGAFPYREIDGSMFVDGAVTANVLFGGRVPEKNRIGALWTRIYPGANMPKMRYWVIFNNQLRPPPITVAARWYDIIMRSVEVSARASSLNSMRQLFLQVEVARLKRGADIELRYVAVPDGWRPPKPGTFIKETMNNLADLGEKLGADPSCWLTEAPTQ
ncbi:MAG TPA: patatin-like phospholipase family protein, partial [Tepidisphaeraceae bacterium]|nr:patatin-like phospholipase family protein [Tepidisphaeraceae bacterium]